MRKVVIGGATGAIPGLVVAFVPLVLASLDVITADESQIGFIGVPLIFIGVFIGTLIGARNSPHAGRVMAGVTIGFLVGLVGGLAISAMAPMGPMWLILAPAAMILGGAAGAHWGDRSSPPQFPAQQH